MDDYHLYHKSLIILILLLTSVIVSIAEVVFFSLDNKNTNGFKFNSPLLQKYLNELIDNQKVLLFNFYLTNIFIYVASAFVSMQIIIELSQLSQINISLLITIQILVLSVLFIFTKIILPKVYFNKADSFYFKISLFIIYWYNILLYPLTKISTEFFNILTSQTNKNRVKNAFDLDEFNELSNLTNSNGTVDEEKELIEGLVLFRSVIVREVMTPRVDIVSVSLNTTFDELIKIINDSGHSRFPLVDDDLDDIVGIIYAKDLLPLLNDEKSKSNLNLKKIAKKALYTPETKLISELLREFQSKKMHIGIVVDEYGGTAGLISLEDILEEIVGEIRDEYDKEENEFTQLEENKYLVLGKMPILELNDFLQEDFSSENDDYETVGGFIFLQIGSIPDVGHSFNFKNFNFTVQEVDNKRISKVLIEKLDL